MAKSTISSLLTKIKRRADYNPNVTDSDLDNLLVDIINDCLKVMFQWFKDAGMWLNTAGSTVTLSTTASQNYVDISTSMATVCDIVRVYEKSNDKTIPLIPFDEFIRKYPDSAASTSAYPDECSLYNERLYLGPTPTGTVSIYVEVDAIPTEVTSVSSCPFKTLFDPLLIAMAVAQFKRWLDGTDRVAINTAEELVLQLKHDLITGASHNTGLNRQAQSREDTETGIICPQIPKS